MKKIVVLCFSKDMPSSLEGLCIYKVMRTSQQYIIICPSYSINLKGKRIRDERKKSYFELLGKP